ncbi:MAG TPA: type II toxin-antitoxin system PemK/MazF family toxin [Clostridia bacterium]|nr:type II toxin-antitoxin system PemK/MazF family toxin [Clostridia bacterium]
MQVKVKRGEMYFAELSPAVGSEQNGYRPVLILQNAVGNRHSPTVVVAAISGKPKKLNMPTHCYLPAGNGLDIPSVVLLEQLRTLDKRRLGGRIGELDEMTMKGIDRALAVSLGLENEKESEK